MVLVGNSTIHIMEIQNQIITLAGFKMTYIMAMVSFKMMKKQKKAIFKMVSSLKVEGAQIMILMKNLLSNFWLIIILINDQQNISNSKLNKSYCSGTKWNSGPEGGSITPCIEQLFLRFTLSYCGLTTNFILPQQLGCDSLIIIWNILKCIIII